MSGTKRCSNCEYYKQNFCRFYCIGTDPLDEACGDWDPLDTPDASEEDWGHLPKNRFVDADDESLGDDDGD